MAVHNVAILGAGIGAQHLTGYLALRDRFAVRTVCDLDAARAAPLVDASGALFAPDIEAVLDDPAVDVVDICLPPHLHFDVAVRALGAGKHVICEKPLVTSLAEADALAHVASETGRSVFPVFQYRFGRAMDQLRALQQAELAGKPLVATLETHWNRGAEYYAVPWRGTWAGERGGAVLGHAIHIHDMLSVILGPVARVFADLGTRVNDIETEDCAALTIRMASGALVTSSITLGAAADTSRLRFCFEGVTVESKRAPYAPADTAWTFTARAPVSQARVDAVVRAVPPCKTGFAGLFEAVADALDGASSRHVTLADGRRSLEFVTGVYGSARSGAPVAFPLAADHPLYAGWLPEGVI